MAFPQLRKKRLNPITAPVPNPSQIDEYGFRIEHLTKHISRKTLLSKAFTRVDMHFHTKYSDGANRPKTLGKWCKRLGIGVSITDHNDVRACRLFEREHPDVFFIPGIEVGTKEDLHSLLYFHSVDDAESFHESVLQKHLNKNKNLSTSLSLPELFDASREYNALTSLAHPFIGVTNYSVTKKLKQQTLTKDDFRRYDAIEVMCSSVTTAANKKAIRFARELEKPFTAGSDGHVGKTLGNSFLSSLADNRDDFLESIRKQNVWAYGRSQSPHQALKSSANIFVRSHLRHPVGTVHYKLRKRDPKNMKKEEISREEII